MSQLSKCFLSGDFREWPLDQATVCELVRVRLVRANKDMTKQYRELRVRSRVVKAMANIYMERHIQDLGRRPGVLKLVQVAAQPGSERPECTREQIRAHIQARVSAEYPEEKFGGDDGAVPEGILAILEADGAEGSKESAFEMKQATMPDTPNVGSHLFQGMRPTIVTDEGDTHGTFSKEATAEATMSEKVSAIDVPLEGTFEKQFVSQYSCRVFPLGFEL